MVSIMLKRMTILNLLKHIYMHNYRLKNFSQYKFNYESAALVHNMDEKISTY